MSRFNGLLSTTYHPPRRWKLDLELKYDTDILTEEERKLLQEINVPVTDDGVITVAAGFETDLASVPRAGWAFIAPFDVARAAVVHDLLYKAIRDARVEGRVINVRKLKKAADKVFLDAMQLTEPKIATWKIWACYSAVRMFGYSSVKPR